MADNVGEEFRKLKLGLQGVYEDVTTALDPITIYVSNIPNFWKANDLAKVLDVADHCVTLKNFGDCRKKNIAFIKPRSWFESDDILRKKGCCLQHKKLYIEQAYDLDRTVPSHTSYMVHKLSEEPFDLTPARSGKPSIHCLNDYVLMHIFGYLDFKEKLRIERVCRRWQSIIYSEVGRQSTVDLNATDCPWRPVLSFKAQQGACSSLYEEENRLQKYKSIMYKMLILNGEHLTSLHLDEYRCVIEVNIVSAIGRLAPNLEVLSMRFSRRRRHTTKLRNIFTRCHKLRVLCIDGINSTEEFFHDLQCCKALEVLRLKEVNSLQTKKNLTLPLKELSFSDVSEIVSPLRKFLQPELKVFRLFDTIENTELVSNYSPLDETTIAALVNTCPQLVELQVRFDVDTPPNLRAFENLKILHLQIDMCDNLGSVHLDIPDVEDLRVEFIDPILEFEIYEPDSFDFSTFVPASVKSFTMPTRPFTVSTYETLLNLPNLERIFFKQRNFTSALLENFVARPQIVEIGAGMLHLDTKELEAMASVRRKALANIRDANPEDSARPLVLHLFKPKTHTRRFQDPLIKVVDLRGESYIYNRVGSTQLDCEWTESSMDFLHHPMVRETFDDHLPHNVFLLDRFDRFLDSCTDDEDDFYDDDSSWHSNDHYDFHGEYGSDDDDDDL